MSLFSSEEEEEGWLLAALAELEVLRVMLRVGWMAGLNVQFDEGRRTEEEEVC